MFVCTRSPAAAASAARRPTALNASAPPATGGWWRLGSVDGTVVTPTVDRGDDVVADKGAQHCRLVRNSTLITAFSPTSIVLQKGF